MIESAVSEGLGASRIATEGAGDMRTSPRTSRQSGIRGEDTRGRRTLHRSEGPLRWLRAFAQALTRRAAMGLTAPSWVRGSPGLRGWIVAPSVPARGTAPAQHGQVLGPDAATERTRGADPGIAESEIHGPATVKITSYRCVRRPRESS